MKRSTPSLRLPRRAWRGRTLVATLAPTLLALGAPPLRADPNGGGDERPVAVPAVAASKPTAPTIDLALCLDTSGSMEGLLDAARQKLWAIVNDLALAEPTPRLRVALLTFGNDGHPAEGGWVKIDAPLTEDLDLVSQQLFALTTNGGTELVGRVLATANASLDWAPEPAALKLVVVAGNESADQDQQVRFGEACRLLIERGITVNAIYCGNPADEIAPGWQEVAKRADGHFAAIDQQNGTVVIATPFDGELAALSTAINDTYLPYGAAGIVAWGNQRAQDANAEACNSATAAARANTKACKLYTCDWDLVEQVKTGQLKLEEAVKEQLPEKLRELTQEQRQQCIDAAWAQRAKLKEQIQGVSAKRDAHVTAEFAKLGMEESSAFDRAVRDALRAQAQAKGLRFPPAPKVPEAKPNDTLPAKPKDTPPAKPVETKPADAKQEQHGT